MAQNNEEKLILTHHQNLYDLSQSQLAAIKAGDFIKMDNLIGQKQMIIEEINGLLAKGFSPEQCRLEVRWEIRKIILDTLALEEELQVVLAKIKGAVQREMILLKQENLLNDRYGVPTGTSRFIDESS